MAYRIAINGYGRIGRCVLRALQESQSHPQLQIVALNDLADTHSLVYLTRYDSTHGRFPGKVDSRGEDTLLIDGQEIRVLSQARIDALPWRELGIDLVMECTGSFTDRDTAAQHLNQGASRVLISNPAQADVDATIIYGVNHQLLSDEHRIISNASCTTNCVVPVIQCLDERFGIDSGVITTIHSAMNDQPVIDAFHHHHLRKTRSAVQSIIPVNTEIDKGIGRILPHLEGRFSAQAMRVPTVNVSAIDLTVVTKKPVDIEAINHAIREGAENSLPLVLACTDEPLASCDFNHDPRSAIVDLSQTRVSGRHLVKVLAWFDNEWAFANRMLDVAELIRKLDNRGEVNE
ncbi:MAG: type I glyceraldehyde-3-phosphate dehydrogenase [Pseudomonadales bacterium]|nr:type I glyceraldehyde-3-phosphate dehydrogenase [Pseudomonadales bacterium]MCP5330273.1 type I glyceraldehyde-3-phosphate dehydrogenase [Pseudomonadales bacterium]MCP5344111.1 type I glyceraldehyde-3-phosphate dehydrogenase [Pseudomonadales bacterium]